MLWGARQITISSIFFNSIKRAQKTQSVVRVLRSEDELELLLRPLDAASLRRHTANDDGEDGEAAALDFCAGGGDAAAFEDDDDDPPPAEGSCDVVLVDAPCSSTGVLRRRPSLRWTLDPQQALAALPEQQKELLAQAQVGGWVDGWVDKKLLAQVQVGGWVGGLIDTLI